MEYLPFFLLPICAIAQSVLLKLIVNRLPKNKGLFVQYSSCALFIFLFWLVFDKTPVSTKNLLLIGGVLGCLNYFGAWFYWSACKINMSRTAIFMPLISMFAIMLYCVFLGEYKTLRPLAIFGVCLHFSAIWIFQRESNKKRKKEEKQDNIKKWLLITVGVIVTNGIIDFLLKVFSFTVPKTSFLLCWYLGSFAFSFTLLWKKEEEKQYNKYLFLLVPLCSLVVIAHLAVLYWAFCLKSGSLVISFHALSLTFMPALVGWILFKESKGITKVELLGFLLGIIAAVLIILSH